MTIGRAARRQLVEHRHVEVAVDGHGRGARDRRGRHHQHVGHGLARALVPQRGPLLDAEAVLLVDHDHAERPELDALLDERVGADGQVDLARRPDRPGCRRRSAAVVRLVSSSTRSCAVEPGPGEQVVGSSVSGTVKPAEQVAHAEVVLLGQHLGRAP